MNEIKAVEVISPVERIVNELSKNQGQLNLEQLSKLLEIQERYDALQAKKAYHVAMTGFKSNSPTILKNRKADFSTSKGRVQYKYADLANVTESINTELSKHGLSASWMTSTGSTITVTCRITHILGYSEETSLSAPADDTGVKNNIQAMGSTISYLQRYTLLALSGLATAESDNDANSISPKISEVQVQDILNKLQNKDLSEKKLLEYMNVKCLEEITVNDFQKVINAINSEKKVYS